MAFYNLDWNVSQVRATLSDATKSLERLCLLSSATSEYYIHRNKDPLIAMSSGALARAVMQSGEVTSKSIEGANESRNIAAAALNSKDSQKGGLNPADQWKLVNFLRNTREKIKNNNLSVMNDKGVSFAIALMMIEQDANDWEKYQDYMTATLTPANLSNMTKDCQKSGNFWPVFSHFNAPVLFDPSIGNKLEELANEK
jgi:hypothetical protein